MRPTPQVLVLVPQQRPKVLVDGRVVGELQDCVLTETVDGRLVHRVIVAGPTALARGLGGEA